MTPILKVENLTKTYDGLKAVDHISFQVNEGEVVGLLGANGAGKTTTIQMILSLVEPTEGRIEIFGKDISRNRQQSLQQMNFVAPYAGLPYNLTVYENLVVFSLLYGVEHRKQKIESLIRDFMLTDYRDRQAGVLSSGEQTRLGLAKALLNDPKLLLLDEPAASLDPAVARELRSLIYKKVMAVGGSILWTSHNMREIETMCDRIIFLSRGKVVADGTLDELHRMFGNNDLEEIFVSIAHQPAAVPR